MAIDARARADAGTARWAHGHSSSDKRRWLDGFVLALSPSMGPWFVRTVLATVRRKTLNCGGRAAIVHGQRPFIGLLWHQHMLLSVEMLAGRKAVFMSSWSRDGEISTRLLRRLGHWVVRGSSRRGGSAAFRDMAHLIAAGHPALLTPDGPKGPPRVAKLGCILAARASQAPLLPMACALARAKEFRNWDRTAFPFPFSSMVLGYGEPISVPADADRATCESIRERVDREMAALEARCRAAL